MKRITIITTLIFIIGCSNVELVDYWKNPDIDIYHPSKVLIVGMTSNLEARQKFEDQLKDELEQRGAESVISLDYREQPSGIEKMTEEDLKALENDLIDEGFDTILFTKVIGVEDKIKYKENFEAYDSTYRKFSDEYLMYQDMYYNPNYYEDYKVYHAETSMYCICPTKDRELIWKGYIDIVDPLSVEETVNDYVRLVILIMEELQVVNPILQDKKIETEDTTYQSPI